LPFSACVAACASASDAISTNAKPLLWPVSRSLIKLTESTVPLAEKASRSDCSVAEYGKLPT